MIVKKTRKQLRKEQRQQKKIRKNEYYRNRNKLKSTTSTDKQTKTQHKYHNEIKPISKHVNSKVFKEKKDKSSDEVTKSIIHKEKREQKKLQKEMNLQRVEVLKQANIDEDQNIKMLEKQLKFNKRKSKSFPKSIVEDGLDYLLEICDSDNLKGSSTAEQQFMETDMDFEEDLALISNTNDERKENNFFVKNKNNVIEGSNIVNTSREKIDSIHKEKKKITTKIAEKNDSLGKHSFENFDSENFDSNVDQEMEENVSDFEELNSNGKNDEIESELGNTDEDSKSDEFWEDIYGRLRRKDGSILKSNEQKYIPPAIREKLENNAIGPKNQEKLNKLKRQIKGLLNRLAEANMHKISVEIEQLYMQNSRNDMNQELSNFIFDALLSPVLTPERLVIEHMMLVAILHANIGTEIGAYFLQRIIIKFRDVFDNHSTENKVLENIILTLSHLYNFRVYNANLLYQVMEKLSNRFTEKDIECILLILKSVGFSLRKDDPVNLKNFILNVQKKASCDDIKFKNDPRFKFMLEILMAIKNNNMTKIPNYDPEYADHLKKLLKNFVRKGLYVSSLNIGLEDLFKANEQGKWWIVGSAWTGKETSNADIKPDIIQTNLHSQKLLDLSKKQRMNTDTRRNIFCIIMSAEDYLDAFEKLLRLGLKNQQEREIINVIIHCCLQEKKFNPYYAFLAQKFCDYDRRFQMTIKYSVWDKLKMISDCSVVQMSNLAKLLINLFIEKGLPLSTLKIMHFSELDKVTLRFVRQILLGILLHENEELCQQVFQKVALGEKLKMFRESLRLFIKHFLLRNLKSDSISDDKKKLLQQRANLVDKILGVADRKVRF